MSVSKYMGERELREMLGERRMQELHQEIVALGLRPKRSRGGRILVNRRDFFRAVERQIAALKQIADEEPPS